MNYWRLAQSFPNSFAFQLLIEQCAVLDSVCVVINVCVVIMLELQSNS